MHAEPTDALSSCSVAASTAIDVTIPELLKDDDAAAAASRDDSVAARPRDEAVAATPRDEAVAATLRHDDAAAAEPRDAEVAVTLRDDTAARRKGDAVASFSATLIDAAAANTLDR